MADFLRHTLGLSEHVYYGNSIADWVIAGLVAAAVWVGLWIVRGLIASRYKQYQAATRPSPLRLIVYLLANTNQILIIALALDAGQQDLAFPRGSSISSTTWCWR